MISAARIHGGLRTKWNLGRLSRAGGWLVFGVVLFLVSGRLSYAQTTAQLTGTVADASGAVIPGADVTLTDQATGLSRSLKTNSAGLFAFPALTPGVYKVRATANGFQSKEVTGIVLHAGDVGAVPTMTLAVGAQDTTVSVEAASEMIATDTGARSDYLDSKQIENLALQGRDVTELLKVLPGATTMSGGLTQTSPSYSDLNVTVQQSAVGSGININGAVNRGGTALLSDGANVIDPGDMASSLTIINPEMTAEVTVQASAFGADTAFGPVVVSTISKSGGDKDHGEAYFDARNSVLNANDWQDNHQGVPQGPQHYYYPGGNFGGPVPFTHKHFFFWGGYERLLQNQGNANKLTSYIPTPEMMAGDFSTDNPDNLALCPNGFFPTPTSSYPQGPWCSDLGGTIYPDGSHAVASSALAAYGSGGGDVGQKIPSQFVDPGAAALAKIWPKANANPATSPGGVNYYQPIVNINNGWLYRVRLDYQLGENTKIYGTYSQAYNSDLASGNGAHLYWTPGNAIPYPGGGETQSFDGKTIAGHFVHSFSASATNDLMAAWAYGSFPFVQPNPAAASRANLGYTYGKIYQTSSIAIPAYSSAGNETFPDFSQASIFENPPGKYAVKKQAPQFADTFTKVWGKHTVKFGAFAQNTDNYQSTFSTYQDGNLSFGGQNPDVITGNLIGSPHNPTANFVMGIASNYSENNASPIADTAYQSNALFVQDHWRTTSRLTLDLGLRFEHDTHWYDRGGIGMAVFYPDRVLSDYNSGKYAPGFYWHAIDEGVPLSGQPNRPVYVNPRFGVAYDLQGNGNTVLRGGIGYYRWVTQTNDVAAALVTAQHVLGYNLPGGKDVMLSEISKLAPPNASAPPVGIPCSHNQPATCSGSQTGLDPSDYSQPISMSYNLTIDRRLKWNSLLEIGYVGSQTHQLSDNSEGIEGSNFSALADQNKTPIGALFNPDPYTGITATNPENVTKNPTPGTCTIDSVTKVATGCYIATNNQLGDYHPYGYAYGTNNVYMNQGLDYTNYNALQVSWSKNTGHLGYNINGTWSKTLATSLQENPYNVRLNYGPASVDRPFVFNASYFYSTGKIHAFNEFINGTLGGWTISGISTWQAGGYIPSFLGNGVPNFGLGLTYVNQPVDANGNSLTAAEGVGTGIGSATYFGTDAPLPIMPVLTCNPTQNLKTYQRVNGNCFNAPAIGQQGGQNYPYMSMAAYFNNDLALYRSFAIHENNQIQFRISAFNWINHPLPQYSTLTPLTLLYKVDYASKAITKNYDTTKFGVMDTKSQAPYQRIIELNVKYFF
ncbi:MAG TPA: carboxypeptidase regulatory-like domain-containing protein [Acidobacteriaceae bacterium]|nr:carboxypeptidase regulatory-like domain-containing protein [Acidobacteriaceae bacterium]